MKRQQGPVERVQTSVFLDYPLRKGKPVRHKENTPDNLCLIASFEFGALPAERQWVPPHSGQNQSGIKTRFTAAEFCKEKTAICI
jgi:hypothetical protein